MLNIALNRSMVFSQIKKMGMGVLMTLSIVAWYSAYMIINCPFPQNLLFIFWIPILIFVIYNIQGGIILWYVFSVLGNPLSIDLPGIPPLHTAQLVLLLLLAGWFIVSYKQIPFAIGEFLHSGKNRILLLLLGWITLSMAMGRLTGVTFKPFEYQFNAWLCVAMAMLTALFISYQFDERLLKIIIWTVISLQTFFYAAGLASGIMQGAGLFGWKSFQEFGDNYDFVKSSPLFLALVFFPQQKFLGKVLLSVAVIVPLADTVLLILSNHRTSVLWLISSIAFILLLTRFRLVLAILLISLPLILFNFPKIQSWLDEQSDYVVTSQNLVYGGGARIALAEDAMQIVKRYPMWGTGSDFYRFHSSLKSQYPDGKIETAPTPHNSWLQVAVDHGLPAAILLIVFCVYLLRDCILLFRSLENRLFKLFVLFFFVTFGAKIFNSFVSSGSILPVFTGTSGDETLGLASIIFSFWFFYGLFLGIENQQRISCNSNAADPLVRE